MPTECLVEMRAQDKETHALLTGDSASLDKVTRCEEYSSLSRLLSVTAYVLKFVPALKQAIKSCRSPSSGLEVDIGAIHSRDDVEVHTTKFASSA